MARILTDGEERVSIQRLHTCMGCTWHRDVVTGAANKVETVHPVYGKTTVIGVARQDIKEHDCEQYRRRIDELKGIWYLARLKGLM